MLKEFTKQYVIDNKGCYSYEDVDTLSFINKGKITINDILKSEIKLKDKGWWLVRKCELTNDQKVQLAYELAYAVLPIFEAKNPDDKRVRECLDAIQLFRDKKITREDLRVKQSACWSARDAYAAADAAAYAAAAAAYAAADAAAAYAAADAAAADAADAADADKGIINKIKKAFTKKKKSYNDIVLDVMLNFAKTME